MSCVPALNFFLAKHPGHVVVDEPSKRIDSYHHHEGNCELEPQVIFHDASVESALKHYLNEAYHVVLESQVDSAVHHH